MIDSLHSYWQGLLRAFLVKPAVVASLPAAFWTLYSLGGEAALATVAIAMPILVAAMGRFSTVELAPQTRPSDDPRPSDSAFESIGMQYFLDARANGQDAAVFEIQIDHMDRITEKYGTAAAQDLLRITAGRLRDLLREVDLMQPSSTGRFSLCLAPLNQFDLALCIQFAGRMQAALEQPVDHGDQRLFATATIGFCQAARAPGATFTAWQDAARTALAAALAEGGGAIRAFTAEMTTAPAAANCLSDDVGAALQNGQIRAWFQPQLCTDTGEISGFEALARWDHPALGVIPPAEFLPLIEAAGLEDRLAEVMLCHSCDALAAWDRSGLHVPQIGINFSSRELRDPKITDKLAWTLDRFDLTPDRLAIEVLENVASSAPDDIISMNINKLIKLGCSIDLDDFGTGSTSITTLRQYAVNRIKIDRSFVIKSDRDPEQQRMVAAILLMAERLGIEAVAEGVETAGEHALLAQLGCDHVQGFGIARPMPFEQTQAWMQGHHEKLGDIPRIARNG